MLIEKTLERLCYKTKRGSSKLRFRGAFFFCSGVCSYFTCACFSIVVGSIYRGKSNVIVIYQILMLLLYSDFLRVP